MKEAMLENLGQTNKPMTNGETKSHKEACYTLPKKQLN